MLALPLQSEVLVWREKDGWNGPYKIAAIDGHNVTVDMVNGPTTFRSTQQHALPIDTIVPLATQPRKRGHPLGLRNKRKANIYITKKKKADLKLAIKLRNNKEVHGRIYIFKSRLRVIIALAPMLVQYRINLKLRDITQAYLQAQTNLKRIILAHLPTKLAPRYPEGTLLHVIKPLYRITKAGELDMSTLTYNPCLLVTNSNADNFSIVSMQTNNTLMLRIATFSAHEEKMLEKAYYTLIIDASNMDNYKATLNLKQKGQGGKIKLYTKQHARGAYIALTSQQPSDKDIKALNKRLKWQMENLNRRLRYIPVNLIDAKLIVFVDGSFANNKDLSSQLGFILMLVNKSTDVDNAFTICGNIIHYSLTKCKRVTRSVLAFKIYGMVNGFDIGIAIATTLQIIIERLSLPAVPLVVCTDLYSLYECLVKLGTTKEKRLIIDIMALRHEDNPADAFTKALLNRALERFVDSNKVTVRIEGWV
ncbi:hypothetical protein BU23DRAFT_585789 [Bimuria novae-zelandiae CBS 107.79]|uniref:Reverse transcriptase Ty1/copia-type domain-containing protein n=1 Tax=Bimuria novae-zelandiae CBS 107.79 TaxID=1447943 RepID=A0A6A5UFN0_9PLEO|nr:hypothetical protein BU23DRAFT_585789 [Bimuria novae-zelandiae CBS 107.79]